MAILDIKKYPDPILRKKCEDVEEITPEIKEVIFNMGETMLKNQGIGLAAPQVGISKRIIVVGTEKGVFGFVNPKILEMSKKTEKEVEGCLSLPRIYLPIKRAREVEIEALNGKGEKIRINVKGLMARVFQHEIDHLEGCLMIDRAGLWQRRKVRKELKQLEKEYASRGQSH